MSLKGQTEVKQICDLLHFVNIVTITDIYIIIYYKSMSNVYKKANKTYEIKVKISTSGITSK